MRTEWKKRLLHFSLKSSIKLHKEIEKLNYNLNSQMRYYKT